MGLLAPCSVQEGASNPCHQTTIAHGTGLRCHGCKRRRHGIRYEGVHALGDSKDPGWSSLTPDVYKAELPEIFSWMLEEGQTNIRTQSLMWELLMLDEDDMFNAVQVLVSKTIAKDFKNLDFGFNGDTTYSTCHRGISPFMVIPVSLAQASQHCRMADRYARVGSNLTLDDVTRSETMLDTTLQMYQEIMDVMKNYCFFLQRILGARCSYFLETRVIARILGWKRCEFEGITAWQVATILWHIFMDAWQFYLQLLISREPYQSPTYEWPEV
jgi:hypothetical protein